MTSSCSLALLSNKGNKAALADAGADWWGCVNFPAIQMSVTPPKAHWVSIPWHPHFPGRVLSGPSPGVGHVGTGWAHLYQSSVLFLSTGACDCSVHPCSLGKPAAGDEEPTCGAVPWIMHSVSAWG